MKRILLTISLYLLALACAETKRNSNPAPPPPETDASAFLPQELKLVTPNVSSPVTPKQKAYVSIWLSQLSDEKMGLGPFLFTRQGAKEIKAPAPWENYVQKIKSQCQIQPHTENKKQSTPETAAGTTFTANVIAEIKGKDCPMLYRFELNSNSQVIEFDKSRSLAKMTAQTSLTEDRTYTKKSFWNFFGITNLKYQLAGESKYETRPTVESGKPELYDTYSTNDGSFEMTFPNGQKMTGKVKDESLSLRSLGRDTFSLLRRVELTLPTKEVLVFILQRKQEKGNLVLQKTYLNGYEVSTEELEKAAKDSTSWPQLPPAILTLKY